jgi:hypothetical protein
MERSDSHIFHISRFRPTSRIWREARALLSEAVSYVGSFPLQSVSTTMVHNPALTYSPYHKHFQHGLQNGPLTLLPGKRVTKQKPFDPGSVGGLNLKPFQWKCSVCPLINSHRPIYDCVVCRQNPSRTCHSQSASVVYHSDPSLSMLNDESIYSNISDGDAYDSNGKDKLETVSLISVFGESLSRQVFAAETNYRINLEWIEFESKNETKNRYILFAFHQRIIRIHFRSLLYWWIFQNPPFCARSSILPMPSKNRVALTSSCRMHCTTRRIWSSEILDCLK